MSEWKGEGEVSRRPQQVARPTRARTAHLHSLHTSTHSTPPLTPHLHSLHTSSLHGSMQPTWATTCSRAGRTTTCCACSAARVGNPSRCTPTLTNHTNLSTHPHPYHPTPTLPYHPDPHPHPHPPSDQVPGYTAFDRTLDNFDSKVQKLNSAHFTSEHLKVCLYHMCAFSC